MKDIELKYREVKITREVELVFKLIIVSIDDMDRFETKKEFNKIRTIKNTCYDLSIDYIPEPIRKSVGGFKDKNVSLFNF